MVAFRKLLPVLVLVALLVGTASMVNAQSLRCTANAGVPPIVRSEGYTELTGDLVVECTGGNPLVPFFANFQLFLNTNITSRLTGDVSEALLMIDEPTATLASRTGSPDFCVSPAPASNSAVPTCNAAAGPWQFGYYNVFRGQRGSQPGTGNENLVVWQGIPVVPPGSNTRTFRFTNVRANAAGLGSSQTLIPTQIVAYISVFPSGTLPIDNPQQTVGYVQQGMVFDVRNCDGSGGVSSANATQAQCTSVNGDWYSDPLKSDALTAQFSLRFREGFQTAFKPRISTLPMQDGAVPGTVFNTESGFVRTAVLGNVGQADTGTRFAARFVNVPANVRLFVGTRDAYATTSTTAPDAKFQLVTTDAAGASFFAGGGITPVNGPNRLACGSNSASAVEVPLTNGAGLAVWEITEVGANMSTIDAIIVPAAWAYKANVQAGQPALGQAQVIGNLAPFYGPGAAEKMAAGLPIPRFVSRTEANNIFRIGQCVTNLLFPYVTNWSNFDTGIAIANTSQDPFSSPGDRLQAGKCTINYYGTLANGNPPTTLKEETDRDVTAGDTLTFILSGGGTHGLKGNPNFQGYIIAQCGFQFAHGFAFITDGPIGQARVAEGYLALVLDGADAGRMRGATTGEVRGH